MDHNELPQLTAANKIEILQKGERYTWTVFVGRKFQNSSHPTDYETSDVAYAAAREYTDRDWRDVEFIRVPRVLVSSHFPDEALAIISKVRINTSGVLRPDDSDQLSYDRFARAVTEQWANLQPEYARWRGSWEKDEALSSEVRNVFQRIGTAYEQIHSAQQVCIGLPCNSVDFHRHFNDGFGAIPQRRLDELSDEVQQVPG